MSYTNLQIITNALRKAGIVDETLSPSTTQQSNALAVMNGYFAMRAADGLNLGYYPQTSTGATFPCRDEFAYGMTLLLARQLASDCGQPIEDPTLNAEIDKADAILAKAARPVMESDLGELPRPQGGPWGGPNWS